MLVKEEKILLMAKESGEDADIMQAVLQVVNNCMINGDANKLTVFDLEFLFIRLRANSVNNITTVELTSEGETYRFEVDLHKVEVKFPGHDKRIMLDSKTGIMMKYPEATLFNDREFMALEGQAFYDALALNCIDYVFVGDAVHKGYTKRDLAEWLENLDMKASEKLREFIMNMPTVHYEQKYTNKKTGAEETLTLRALQDFFMLA